MQRLVLLKKYERDIKSIIFKLYIFSDVLKEPSTHKRTYSAPIIIQFDHSSSRNWSNRTAVAQGSKNHFSPPFTLDVYVYSRVSLVVARAVSQSNTSANSFCNDSRSCCRVISSGISVSFQRSTICTQVSASSPLMR
jgi:hypothetical protein